MFHVEQNCCKLLRIPYLQLTILYQSFGFLSFVQISKLIIERGITSLKKHFYIVHIQIQLYHVVCIVYTFQK